MQFTVVSAALALYAASAVAQSNTIPQCALTCFATAIGETSCSALDSYCQCTTGSQVITESVTACLCKSTCTLAELAQVQEATNNICSAALSASGSSYSARSADPNACASGSSSMSGSTAAATTGGMDSSMTSTTSGAMSTSMSATTTSTDDDSSTATSVEMQTTTGGASRADVARAAAVGMLGFLAAGL